MPTFRQHTLQENSINAKTTRIRVCFTTLLYASLNLLLLTHHEAWRDEAQAWMIARNLSLQEIIEILSTEGHLLPFFLILKVWYKLGGAYAWIGLISLSLMTIAVAIFLYKAPFSFCVKVLLIFSPIFFYYNPVIARCYSLVVLMLVIVAAVRRDRENSYLLYCISVALLMQTHVLIIPLAVALTVELSASSLFAQRSKKHIAMSLIPIASMVAAACELYQRKQTAFITFENMQNNFRTHQLTAIKDRLKTIIIRVYAEGRIYHIVLALLAVCLLLIIAYAIRRRINGKRILTPEVMVCGIGIAGYLTIIGFVRACDHIQMALVFYMILMFAVWIVQDAQDAGNHSKTEQSEGTRNKLEKASLTAVSIVLILMALLSYKKEMLEIKQDYYQNYSNSKTFAEEAIEYLPVDSVVLIRQEDYKVSAPYAYIADKRDDIVFWDVDEDSEFKCIIWGKEYPSCDIISFGQKRWNNCYYLTETKKEDIGTPILAAEDINSWDENYYLYEIRAVGDN